MQWGFCKWKWETEIKPTTTNWHPMCGLHGNETPHACCITTNYMVRHAVSIQQPCFHSAPIPITSKGPTAYDQELTKTHCTFTAEDCSNQSIMGSWLTAQLCGSSGILDDPYLEVLLMFEEEFWEMTLPNHRGTLGECWYLSSRWVQGAHSVQPFLAGIYSKKELFCELSHKGIHSKKESILRRKC